MQEGIQVKSTTWYNHKMNHGLPSKKEYLGYKEFTINFVPSHQPKLSTNCNYWILEIAGLCLIRSKSNSLERQQLLGSIILLKWINNITICNSWNTARTDFGMVSFSEWSCISPSKTGAFFYFTMRWQSLHLLPFSVKTCSSLPHHLWTQWVFEFTLS